MTIYGKIIRGRRGCYICGKKHHKGVFYFPKDFPNKWKWCCTCLHVAQYISAYGYDDFIKFTSSWSNDQYDYVSIAKRVKMVMNLE